VLVAQVEGGQSSPPAVSTAPDRVYVRVERFGGMELVLWGMEHGGRRSEVAEPVVRARMSAGGETAATRGIERDLRRGVGLSG
jgi:hypothetical protein